MTVHTRWTEFVSWARDSLAEQPRRRSDAVLGHGPHSTQSPTNGSRSLRRVAAAASAGGTADPGKPGRAGRAQHARHPEAGGWREPSATRHAPTTDRGAAPGWC